MPLSSSAMHRHAASEPVVHVVPALPPVVDGVGDFGLALAGALGELGWATTFVAAHDSGSSEINGFPVFTPARRDRRSLADLLGDIGATRIIVHFSGYGYARHGLCFWLEQGLRRWKNATGGRVFTIFHEVYASGRIWQRSFWTSPPQRLIASRLAALSEAAITTSDSAASQIRQLSPKLPLEVMPVFSNVGETRAPMPFDARKPVAVIFGSAPMRRRTYEAFAREPGIATVLKDRFGIERLVDIGAGEVCPDAFLGLPVTRMGVTGARQVSEVLASARAGLVDYPNHVITKSGIFAAYLSHGLLALNSSSTGDLPADLRAGREFLDLSTMPDGDIDPAGVAAAGYAWYAQHDLTSCAARIAGLIQ